MIDFIIDNLASVIVGTIVFGIILAVIIKLIHDKRHHINSCSGGCGDCPLAGECHKEIYKKEKSRQ